jgi:hypothetical protein
MTPFDTAHFTICLSHADPGAVPGSAPFATGSPQLHDAWDTARRLVEEFDPDIVLFFGTDHRRAFLDVIPTVAVALAELRVPGLRFTSDWDHELLAGLASTDDTWLDSVGRDIARRGGNGANEAITWVAAWAAGREPLATLAYEFDESHFMSTAVVTSVSALSPQPS